MNVKRALILWFSVKSLLYLNQAKGRIPGTGRKDRNENTRESESRDKVYIKNESLVRKTSFN